LLGLVTLFDGQTTHEELLTQAERSGHLAHVLAPEVVVTRPTAQVSHACVSPFRKVPAGHGSAARTSAVSVGAVVMTPVVTLSTGSAELRSDVARAPEKAVVAFSAERIADACVVLVVVTAKATAADACIKCLPAGVALVTAVMATAEADTASVDAMVLASVAFCAAPKLALETPASVTLEVNVVCVELAKPGGFTVHATAPAAGEYEPGEQG
jgi:hypothetical protein